MGYAQDYDKLTPKQGELLAQIAGAAKELGGEPTFLALFEKGVTTEFLASGERFSTEWSGAKIALAVFDKLGLVHMHSDSLFALRQAALEYPEWRKLPNWCRRLSVMWDSWESEVRGGIITIVASVLASVAVSLIIR